MTLLFPALLGGAAMIAVPIILHLIMRQRPKLLEFPALRFVQRRHDQNQRRLRLRHLLLLLLRAGAIAMLALALARPSIKFSNRFASQEAPVAAALIFDAAPHMQYRRDKKTRLEAAQELGQWLLQQLPPESQTMVCDSGMTPQSFDADRQLSKQRIRQLETVSNPRALTRIVGEAADVLQKSELQAKEVYVFTDLSRGSWPAEDATYLQDRLGKLNGIAVYLIDVGVTDPNNFALGDLNLSQQVIPAGASVDIQTEISCVGAGGERLVELDLLTADRKVDEESKQIKPIKQLKPGTSETLDFRLSLRQPGTKQGVVRILGQDSLSADDERYFTIEVRPAWPVLLVAQPPVAQSAVYLMSAIAPADAQKRGTARYKCDTIDYTALTAQTRDKSLTLENYAAVCLLDPPALDADVWQRLTDYAAAGHGVGVFLGRHAQPVETFNSPAAQQLLPGQLRGQVPREEGNTYLAPQNYQNPILKPFGGAMATRTPWNRFPVYRYWRIDLNPGGSTIIPYNDGRPALVERTIGTGRIAGRVLMTTTPFSDLVTRRDAWNALPSSSQMAPWPFVGLARQIMAALVGSGEQQLNYLAGTSTVMLPVGDPNQRQVYVLYRPDNVNTTLPPPEKAELAISGIDRPGNYQVQSAGEPRDDRGFSVNLPARLTDLSRLSETELRDMFGSVAPQVARSNEQIVRNQHEARVGREIFSWLIIVFAGLLSVEYIVSNWFYKPE